MNDLNREAEPEGWILYDDSCGICRRWIPFWVTTLRKAGFEIAPLQAEWVKGRLGLDGPEELLQDLRILLPDGKHLDGAEAYRYAMRRIWWAYPIYLLSIIPVLKSAFDGGYRTFAAHRHSISRSCGLEKEG